MCLSIEKSTSNEGCKFLKREICSLFVFSEVETIAKGQKQLQDDATQRSKEQYTVGKQAQQNLITGTPEMQADQQRVATRRATINSGDYLNAKDFYGNKDRVAEQQKIRDNVKSLTPTGAGALALPYANSTQIALADKVSNSEFARDQAAQNEQDIRDYNAQTDAMEQNLINRQIGVNQSVMGEGFQQANVNQDRAAQIARDRSASMMQMVGMALGGFSSLATMGMSSGLKIGSSAISPSSIPGFSKAINYAPALTTSQGQIGLPTMR